MYMNEEYNVHMVLAAEIKIIVSLLFLCFSHC